MKNKNIAIAIATIIIFDIFIGWWIFSCKLEYSIAVSCLVTLLAGSIGGIGTLITVVSTNNITTKQLKLNILQNQIAEIKELIEQVLRLQRSIIELKNLDLSNTGKIDITCTKLIDSISSIKVNLMTLSDKEKYINISDYFTKLNTKICDLKYYYTIPIEFQKNNINNINVDIQVEMINIQMQEHKLSDELEKLYKNINEL